jgi:hypothetical protein
MRPVKICNCRSLRCPRCGSTSKTPNPNCEGCRGRHCTTRWCIGNQCVDIYDPGCCDYGLACSWCRAISGYNDHTDRDCGGSYGAYIVQVPLTLDLDHVYCPQLCCKKYCSQSDELPLEAVQHSDYHDREDDGAESPQSNCATIGSGSRGRDRHDDSDDEINDNFDNGHEDDESSALSCEKCGHVFCPICRISRSRRHFGKRSRSGPNRSCTGFLCCQCYRTIPGTVTRCFALRNISFDGNVDSAIAGTFPPCRNTGILDRLMRRVAILVDQLHHPSFATDHIAAKVRQTFAALLARMMRIQLVGNAMFGAGLIDERLLFHFGLRAACNSITAATADVPILGRLQPPRLWFSLMVSAFEDLDRSLDLVGLVFQVRVRAMQ